MVEKGEIIKVKKDKVIISFDRKTECDKCGMCAFGKDDMKVKLTLKNDVNAVVGDIVEVSMGDKFVLASAFIVYLIPIVLVGILIGIGIACKLSDIVQFILAITGLLVGFLISFLVDKKLKMNKGFSPVITGIVGHVDDDDEEDIISKNT